jgi:GntR family phosphonate transport system transcriptional regulator
MAANGLPVYLRIAEDLKRDIRDQIYQIGDQLPTEAALSERFAVNRHTLRQAIAVLRQEGLLRVEQGRGTFVAAAPIRYAIGKRVRYNEALKAQGVAAQYQLIKCVEMAADVSVAKALQLQPGAPVAWFERLSSSPHTLPLSLSSGYFPWSSFRIF